MLFVERKNCREVKIACGSCIGCRIARRDGWAIRCFLESKLYERNHFVTLTYSPEHFPKYGALEYQDFQLFLKRLRNRIGRFRFFVAGEYGEQFNRPHFHALLFGAELPDLTQCNSMYSRHRLYTSELVNECWKKGFHSIGEVSLSSARYCAAYVVSKRSKDDPVYERVDSETGEVFRVPREFARMSLKPGIGFPWLEKYWRDIFATGNFGVPIDGRVRQVPQYFAKVLDRIVSGCDVDQYEFARLMKAVQFQTPENNTRERLAVREEVAQARVRFNNERRGG